MATPTPMKHAPSQQGRTPSQSQHGAAATPPVSTPFSASQAHATFSPRGARSSPQQIKKSPANSSTLMGHGGGNAPVNFDSPSAAAALGALGISGGLDLGLDNVGVGGLGTLGALGSRGDDDERAKRLQAVLGIIKNIRGHVSETGLERLAKSIGLECLWEDGMGVDKSRTLIVAGSALALEISFSNNIVQNVSLSFPESHEIVMKHVDKAGQILLDDLKLRPTESPLTKKLDKFAANLERLALLDKLSVMPALNLHEAVAGVHESLLRLYNWDLDKLREDPAMGAKSEEVLAMTAMCTRHGHPAMHARGRLGLSLDYWKEERLVRAYHPGTKALTDSVQKTWGLLIGCVAMGPLVYQPVRVSHKWLSDDIEKLTPTDEDLLVSGGRGPILDWQDPDNTILPSGQDSKAPDAPDAMHADAALSAPKLPEVVFNARFDPPVTVTLSVWHQICQSIGLTPEPEFSPATYDTLNFPIVPGSQDDPSEPRMISCTKEVQVRERDGSRATASHDNTLFIYKPVYGRTLEELPFSHPSQLVRMLPTLRQYAFLATLLERSFNMGMPDIFTKPPEKEGDTAVTTTVRQDFAQFLKETRPGVGAGAKASGSARRPGEWEASTDSGGDAMYMDVVLTAHPVPRLHVVFPFRSRTADIMLEIRLNGVVHVVSQNILPEDDEMEDVSDIGGDGGKGKAKQLAPQDLGRLLEVCEDLGQWCEWIRSRRE